MPPLLLLVACTVGCLLPPFATAPGSSGEECSAGWHAPTSSSCGCSCRVVVSRPHCRLEADGWQVDNWMLSLLMLDPSTTGAIVGRKPPARSGPPASPAFAVVVADICSALGMMPSCQLPILLPLPLPPAGLYSDLMWWDSAAGRDSRGSMATLRRCPCSCSESNSSRSRACLLPENVAAPPPPWPPMSEASGETWPQHPDDNSSSLCVSAACCRRLRRALRARPTPTNTPSGGSSSARSAGSTALTASRWERGCTTPRGFPLLSRCAKAAVSPRLVALPAHAGSVGSIAVWSMLLHTSRGARLKRPGKCQAPRLGPPPPHPPPAPTPHPPTPHSQLLQILGKGCLAPCLRDASLQACARNLAAVQGKTTANKQQHALVGCPAAVSAVLDNWLVARC